MPVPRHTVLSSSLLASATIAFSALGCGAHALAVAVAPPAPTPAAATPEPAAAATPPPAPEPEAPRQLPSKCAEGTDGNRCLFPDEFVDRLCRRAFVDTTLVLFQRSAPWRHVYLRRKVDAWFTGGPSSKATLAFDEEVLVLRFHAPSSGGMVVEGAGGTYDVLRWDGRCFTLDSDEITPKRPPEAGAARLKWDRIGANMQAAILQNDDVKRAYDRRSKACKNAQRDDLPPACETADSMLGLAIANHVRAVDDLPAPETIP